MTGEKNPYLSGQLDRLLGIYQHHLDLFWKWITLYITVITALGAYLFNNDILPETKRVFPFLIAAASVAIAFGCLILGAWLKELQNEIEKLTGKMALPHYPGFLGIRMTRAAFWATVIFAIFNIAYALYGTFS